MEKKFSYVAKLPDTDELVGVIVVDHKVVRSTSNPLSWVHFSIVKYSFQVRLTFCQRSARIFLCCVFLYYVTTRIDSLISLSSVNSFPLWSFALNLSANLRLSPCLKPFECTPRNNFSVISVKEYFQSCIAGINLHKLEGAQQPSGLRRCYWDRKKTRTKRSKVVAPAWAIF